MAQSAISRRLAGTTPITVPELLDLASILGLDPRDLLPQTAPGAESPHSAPGAFSRAEGATTAGAPSAAS